MPSALYEDHGLRFEYPSEWAMDVTDDGSVVTIDLQHPGGIAFLLITADLSCPDPGSTADAALEAMQEEYPELDADPYEEVVNDRLVSGHDVQFFSLDLSNTARIRCFRTFNRTILVFGQWSDLVESEVSDLAESIIRSVEHSED